MKRYKDTYVDAYPEATVRVKQLDYQATNNPVEVRLKGIDYEALRQYGDTLKKHMEATDGLVWVHSDWDGSLPTMSIDLKKEEASRMGITRSLLSANLAALYGGLPMTTVWEDDYPVSVMLRTVQHDTVATAIRLDEIQNTLVPTALPGVWVLMHQVAEVAPDWASAQIAHRNGVPCFTVGADLRSGVSQPVAMHRLRPWLEHEFRAMLPDDMEMMYGGLDAVNDSTMSDIIKGLIASVMIVFFFLLFNFKRFRLTILALSGTMLCLPGGFLGLALFGCDVSMTAIIGVVSLIGINVRNTIVMFDYAEQFRHKGMDIGEVSFEAGRRRMRPIFLTSATTAVGVIPMIVHGSSLWMPMGVVICFGTLCAIFLIVTVMPVAYWKLFARSKEVWV